MTAFWARFAWCVLLALVPISGSAQSHDYKITILSTMLADTAAGDAHSSIGEWGFAALVEIGTEAYLYDTGNHPRLVLENARKLNIDLSRVEHVILSHNHHDHVGGLLTLRESLRKKSPKALSKLHIAEGFLLAPADPEASGRDEAIEIVSQYQSSGGEVFVHSKPVMVSEGVWLTGPVPRIHDEKNWSGSAQLVKDGSVWPDTIPEDMTLVLETDSGLVLVSGCGHAGIINIVDHAMSFASADEVHAAIGGFHLINVDEQALSWTAGHFRRVGLDYFIGAHCTGLESAYRLRSLAKMNRNTAVVGAVGQKFTANGISPGVIAR